MIFSFRQDGWSHNSLQQSDQPEYSVPFASHDESQLGGVIGAAGRRLVYLGSSAQSGLHSSHHLVLYEMLT